MQAYQNINGSEKRRNAFPPKVCIPQTEIGFMLKYVFHYEEARPNLFWYFEPTGIKSRLPGTQGLSFPGGDEYVRGQRTLWMHLQKPNLLSPPQKRDRGWMSQKQPCSVLLSATRKAWESRRDLPPRVTLKSHFYPMIWSIRTIRIQDSGPCPN